MVPQNFVSLLNMNSLGASVEQYYCCSMRDYLFCEISDEALQLKMKKVVVCWRTLMGVTDTRIREQIGKLPFQTRAKKMKRRKNIDALRRQ